MLWLAAATYVHATIDGTVKTQPAEFDHLLFWSTVATFAVALFTAGLAWSTRKLARETKQSIDVSQAGLRLELIREARAVAPLVVAGFVEVVHEIGSSGRRIATTQFQLTNKGTGVAMKLRFSGVSQRGKVFPSADNVFPPLAAGESESISAAQAEILGGINQGRIRYEDVYGNRYITEYTHIGNRTDLPVLRRPWVAKEMDEPRPDLWSGEVSWPIAHYEPIIGWPDNGVEPGAPRATIYTAAAETIKEVAPSAADDLTSD